MKNLKEIAREAMVKYNEMNPVLASYTEKTGRYSIAGIKDMQDNLYEVSDRMVLMKSNSKGPYAGEAVLPIEIEDDAETFVYLNIGVKTNSPRVVDTFFCKDSLANKTGVTPVGMTVIRKNPEDGLYYFSQLDFGELVRKGKQDIIEDLVKDLKNVPYNDLLNDIVSISGTWGGASSWYINPSYGYEETCNYVLNFDDEKWMFLNNDARLGLAIWTKYLNFEHRSLEKDGKMDRTVIVGKKVFGNKVLVFPEKYLSLYMLASENKEIKRKNKARTAKKGSVQERITRYSDLLETLNLKDMETNTVFIERLPSEDIDCAVLRFCKTTYRDDGLVEKYRIFVENSKLTFAENVDGVWLTTKVSLSYNFTDYKIAPFDRVSFKGTKLQYLTEMITELNKIYEFSSTQLIQVLGNNLFELIFSDPALKELFVRVYKKESEKDRYWLSLTSVARDIFGKCLDELINSEKRIKNLPKKKWFKLTPKQMKKVNAYNDKFFAFIENNANLFNTDEHRYGNADSFNMYALISDLSMSSRYGSYYFESREYPKFDIKVIASLSEKEFDEYLDFLFRMFTITKTTYVAPLMEIFGKFNSIERKNEALAVVEMCDGNYSLLRDAMNMVDYINRYTERTTKLPVLKKGLESLADIREWHDELVEIQNQIDYERNRRYRQQEQERYAKLQESFDKQQKDWKKYEMTDGEFVIKYPAKPSDLSFEGLSLHHCVKSFIDKVAHKQTTILFIRKVEEPETPFFTMEVCDGAIRQAHGACNCNIPVGSSLENFVNNFAEKHNLVHDNMNRMLA